MASNDRASRPISSGRPSYSYHTFIIGGLRLPLDVEALPGNESHGVYGAEALWRLLDHRLPADAQPWCVWGDISYGNEEIISGCESRRRDYLFKLRKSTGIKALIGEIETPDETWVDAGQGWQGCERRISLMGWSSQRRVIVLRRVRDPARPTPVPAIQQAIFVADLCPDDGWEYAVLVTSLIHPIPTIAQFYRDRADSENTFADLKNDWGWGGFTTHDQGRNQLMARLIALVFTWWNIFIRQVSPLQHREGHVSRPALLHGVARRATHAGSTLLRVTSIHAKAKHIMAALSTISASLAKATKHTATQLADQLAAKPWDRLIAAIFETMIKARAGPTCLP